jgi:hypothetical protein
MAGPSPSLSGAFAIVKLLGEKLLGENSQGLGKLHFPEIAVGMIVFTSVMVFDIYTFGLKWHALAKEIALEKEIDQRKNYEIFGRKGQVVLFIIGLLLCAGWALAAWQS